MIPVRRLARMLVGPMFLATAAMAADDEVRIARLEVLEELAEEGIYDAYYELAGLISAHTGSTPRARDAAIRYLAVSASNGRSSAVRWLGYRLLRDFDADREAATLISLAALMGDEKAAIDLGLWPKLTRVSEQTMTQAFSTAVNRLADGRILDCAELPFDCLEGTEAATSVAAADVLYAMRLREQGPYPDAESVNSVFETVRDNYVAFPETRFRRFQAENQKLNARRRGVNVTGNVTEQREDTITWEERARRDRERDRREAARRYLDKTLEADIERYRERLIQAVERINRHRSPGDRIELDAVIESIRSSGN